MRFIIICMFLFASGLLTAQNFYVMAYDRRNGLPADEVRHVIKDRFGYLWLASDNGLIRFDGKQFESFNHQVPSQYGHYFCQTQNGFFYSHDAGISLIQPGLDSSHIELFQPASIDPQAPELYYPDQLFKAKDGALWISQPNGKVTRLENGQQQDFLFNNTNVKENTKAFFGQSSRNIIWIASQDGALYFFEKNSSELNKVASFSRINGIQINGNDLWLAGEQVHHLEVSPDGKSVREVKRIQPPGEVSALALDSGGNLFLGIREQGLYLLDHSKPGVAAFITIFGNNDPHRVDELPFKTIHSIEAQDEHLMISSSEGLGILRKRFFESASALPNGNTTAISPADNGKVFVNFGDLYVIEKTKYGFSGKPIQVGKQASIASITAAKGKLWMGTNTGNLVEMDQTGRSTRSINLSQRGEGIFFLHHDQQNRLWFCQAPAEKPIIGVGMVLPNGQIKEYGSDKGLENRILVITETERGRIYAGGIGKGTYLYRYLPEVDQFANLSIAFDFYVSPNFEVHDLTVDQEGVVWLATTDGLLRFDMDRIRKVDLGPAFEQVEIRAVEHMPDGSIWLATDTEGILRYHHETTVNIGEESGLPSKVMAYRSLVRDQENRLWAGTAEGLVFSLDTNPQPQTTMPPWLINVNVDKQKITSDEFTLLRGSTLQVEVNVPAFHGYRTYYQYQLDGQAWSSPSTERKYSFANLSVGKHNIAIRSRKEGGSLWSEPLKLVVTVSQHWYEYQWVQIVIFTGLLIGLSWFFLFRRYAYKQRLSKLGDQLKLKQAAVERREADLAQAQRVIKSEQREQRVNLLALEILQRLVAKVNPGMNWDFVLETLSDDLLKMPGVIAFEIVIRKGKQLEREGYTEKKRDYISAKQVFDPKSSLAASVINRARPQVFRDLTNDVSKLLNKPDPRATDYRSAIAVPFYHGRQQAVIFLYSDQPDYFDEFHLKTIGVLGKYLEQIT